MKKKAKGRSIPVAISGKAMGSLDHPLIASGQTMHKEKRITTIASMIANGTVPLSSSPVASFAS